MKHHFTPDIKRTPIAVLIAASITVLTACGSSPKTAEAPKPVSVVVGSNAPTAAPVQPVAAPPSVAAATPTAAPLPTSKAEPSPVAAAKPYVIESGMFRCEDKQTVAIKRIIDGGKAVVMGYKGKDYELARVVSDTGAYRFENKTAGFAWIQVVGKALLLDTKRGSRIANDCKL